MQNSVAFGCAVLLAFVGCATRPEVSTSQRSEVFRKESAQSSVLPFSEWARVKIDAKEGVFVNQRQVTTEEFNAECDHLKRTNRGIRVFVSGFDPTAGPPRVDILGYPALIELPVAFVLKESEIE